MQGINEVTLLGSVGQDPEVRDAGGQKLAKFSLATNRQWTDKTTGERKKDTTWHNIEAWGTTAESVSKWVKKGDLLLIKGEIRNGKYEAKDGTTKYTSAVQIRDYRSFTKHESANGAANGSAGTTMSEAAATESLNEFKAAPASSPAPTPAPRAQEPATATVTATAADVRGGDDDLPF